MESVINKYIAYEPYASEVGEIGYKLGIEIAEKAIKDGKNPYEVMYVLIDNIASGFAVARVRHGTSVRMEERRNKK